MMLLYLKKIDVKSVFLEVWHRKEAFIWLTALTLLALSHPADHHYTLCPFHNMGWDFCPGCGIGRSISSMFRLQFVESFASHPLGIPAVIILIHRTTKILTKR